MTSTASRSRSPRPRTPARRDEGNIVVRRSAIQGRGVFATRDLKRGERIVEYTGERISNEEASARYDDEKVSRHHTFLFGVDDDLCIDGVRGGNDARFINHSCDPNAFAKIERRRVFIYARRAIRAGDEILYDYWYSVDEGYTLDDLKRIYPCRCGSPKCRGTMYSREWLAKMRRKARRAEARKQAGRKSRTVRAATEKSRETRGAA